MATNPQTGKKSAEQPPKVRIGVLVVAYNATSTIARVLTRIPESTWERIEEVFIFDDCSSDATAAESSRMRAQHPHRDKIRIFRNAVNLGYGGNQKRGFLYAIQQGFDIVVLLHGDGQYAPECMDRLVEPLVNGRARAVLGSRMLVKGEARKGGMPLYKYLGNRLLTGFENRLLQQRFSEYHSGYRAYHLPSLARLPFLKNSNDFHFDNEIILQMIEAGYPVEEVPIPTYYGGEICYVNGMKYAWNVAKTAVKYRLHKAGLWSHAPEFDVAGSAKYTYKKQRFSSHNRIAAMATRGRGRPRVLDIGCASGALAGRLAAAGCEVAGIDLYDNAEARRQCAQFFVADVEKGIPLPEEEKFDYVIMADILEHVRNPELLLLRAQRRLKPGAEVIASTGNVGNLYIRLMLLMGKFSYTERGILDRTHARLFTRGTFRRLFRDCGFSLIEEKACPIPFENVAPGAPRLSECLSWTNMGLAWLWPSLFAYQFVVRARVNTSAPSFLLRQDQIHSPYLEWQETGPEAPAPGPSGDRPFAEE